MKNIAIIPARSGSKGLKNKNIKLLCGKPLIAYTIEAALRSGIFSMVIVSTDSEKYAYIAKQFGADVPYLRSAALSDDDASSWDVAKDVLLTLKEQGFEYEIITLLQPTSPLRTHLDIENAYRLFQQKNANAIVSVCEVDHSPMWSNTLPNDKSMNNFLRNEIYTTPRQRLGTYYRINGAIYMVRVDHLLRTESIYNDQCFAYVMDKRNSIDIDDETDFLIATALMNYDT